MWPFKDWKKKYEETIEKLAEANDQRFLEASKAIELERTDRWRKRHAQIQDQAIEKLHKEIKTYKTMLRMADDLIDVLLKPNKNMVQG